MPDKKRLREVTFFSLFLLLLIGFFLLIGETADARAGGGHNYSGGGGSSSSRRSSGGGGGELDLIFLLFRLIIHYPAVGIPVTIVVVFVVVRATTKVPTPGSTIP